jgi:hypothetical protein
MERKGQKLSVSARRDNTCKCGAGQLIFHHARAWFESCPVRQGLLRFAGLLQSESDDLVSHAEDEGGTPPKSVTRDTDARRSSPSPYVIIGVALCYCLGCLFGMVMKVRVAAGPGCLNDFSNSVLQVVPLRTVVGPRGAKPVRMEQFSLNHVATL